jgi:hypothetical protein
VRELEVFSNVPFFPRAFAVGRMMSPAKAGFRFCITVRLRPQHFVGGAYIAFYVCAPKVADLKGPP